MRLSAFGQRFAGPSGIRELMEDLGGALAGTEPVLMLGGGNPSHIPDVQLLFRQRLRAIAEDPGLFARVVGNYDSPQGDGEFIAALAGLLRREFGWPLTTRNIVLTHGSQSAFFMLFNLFAGPGPDGRMRRILLPMTPEYIGYADVGLHDGLFVAARPRIELLDDGWFKYRPDFDGLTMTDDVAALCISRPTNPTGNVITDAELAGLADRARRQGVPLIVDGAYGLPFPNIVFTEATPSWDDNVVLCLSLSKIGLPGLRTGIVVASEPVVDALAGMNAIFHLANNSMGAALAIDLVRGGDILTVSREVVMPYYRDKAVQACAWLRAELAGLDFRIHRPEGAIFLWLWFPGLPIDSDELYRRLKRRGVLVISGRHFFPGLRDEWRHRDECLRLTYAQDGAVVRDGIRILAEEVRRAYQEG